MKSLARILLSSACILNLFTAKLFADEIQTTDGSILRGTLTKIEDGVIFLETQYAGVLQIQQSATVRIVADSALPVVLKDGNRTTLAGSTDSIPGISPDRITSAGSAATQAPSSVGPEASETIPSWQFEGAVGIHGKSGNSNKHDFSGAFTALREREQDRLEFNLRYQMSKSETATGASLKTADETIAKADYTAFFQPQLGWYVRETLEQDRFENLELRSLTSAGLSWKALTNDRSALELSAGTALRYESYGFDLDGDGIDERTGSTSEPGLNLGLRFQSTLADWAEWESTIEFNPTFADFSDYRLDHLSTLDMPLGSSDLWKLRFSLANQYNSKVPAGTDKLDTTYSLSILLKWK